MKVLFEFLKGYSPKTRTLEPTGNFGVNNSRRKAISPTFSTPNTEELEPILLLALEELSISPNETLISYL